MTLDPTLITAPAELPVTLAEAKAHLRIDHDDDDDGITAMIGAATGHLDGWRGVLGRCIVLQEWQQQLQRFSNRMPLPLGDAREITGVQYYDADRQLQTLDEADFKLQRISGHDYVMPVSPDYVYPATAPQWVGPVMIKYTAGFGVAADVPLALKQAILLLTAHYYESREAVTYAQNVTVLPMAVEALTAPLRLRGV